MVICLSHLSSVGIEVKAIITDYHLSLVRDVGGDSGDKLQVIHPLFFGSPFAVPKTNLTLCLVKEELFREFMK